MKTATIHAILRAHGFCHGETGGGCEALQNIQADGSYLLATNDDAALPESDHTIIGIYSGDGEEARIVFDGDAAGAADWITANIDQMNGELYTGDSLTDALADYCTAQRLPLMSADDILRCTATTREQTLWLITFIDRWDAAEARESVAA
jgi:hypothetical protein